MKDFRPLIAETAKKIADCICDDHIRVPVSDDFRSQIQLAILVRLGDVNRELRQLGQLNDEIRLKDVPFMGPVDLTAPALETEEPNLFLKEEIPAVRKAFIEGLKQILEEGHSPINEYYIRVERSAQECADEIRSGVLVAEDPGGLSSIEWCEDPTPEAVIGIAIHRVTVSCLRRMEQLKEIKENQLRRIAELESELGQLKPQTGILALDATIEPKNYKCVACYSAITFSDVVRYGERCAECARHNRTEKDCPL